MSRLHDRGDRILNAVGGFFFAGEGRKDLLLLVAFQQDESHRFIGRNIGIFQTFV